jgi:sugar (pentulose or hexulose) kinase
MFIGIDIGTTSVKSVLVDAAGHLVASASAGTAATPVTDRAAGEMNTP